MTNETAASATPAYLAEQPRPPEIRDPILRLFIEEIIRQTPNGEAIRVKYRPNGEWSVLPEATGKADAGLVEALEIAELALATVVEGDPMGVPKNTQCRHGRYTFEGCESCTAAVLDPALEAVRAALIAREAHTTGADGGSRQPTSHPDSALEQWKLVRGICNNSPMFSDARGWKRVTVELLSALRQPAPRADDALPIARMLGDLLATIHRDGGHRQDEVGTEQAWMEAMMTVPFLLEAKDTALASDEPTAAKGD